MAESCGDCKHWKKPTERDNFGNVVEFEYPGGDTKTYDEIEARQDADDQLFGECMGVLEGWDLPMDEPTPIAVVLDGSTYKANLFTQAEFGCKLFEAKE